MKEVQDRERAPERSEAAQPQRTRPRQALARAQVASVVQMRCSYGSLMMFNHARRRLGPEE